MKAVLSGEAWVNVRRGLLPDDVVNLRVTAKCWNNGQLYGDLGEIFFMLLIMKQYIFYESGREPMKLRNPVLETIRRRGLGSMVGSTPEDTSLRDILTTWGNGCRYCEGQFTLSQQDAPIISGSVFIARSGRYLGQWVSEKP